MTQSFGKYQLEKKLATGGMAEVWLARQTGIEGFNRHVVIKRILPHLAEDPEFVHMFLNEAKIASRFNHPNIAQIYDLGETEGTYFIAMEFIHGEDLARIMRRAFTTGQWVARPLAIRIVADACAGLYYAHSRTDEQGRPLRVVHRDISPQNILVSFDGSVKLVDFGIAKAADQASNTQSGALKGKFAYMAPEQAQGKPLDNRSDIFALGLVLYELITGIRPLKRESELATLQAALECVIEAPSKAVDVPEEIDEVVMKALAKAQDDRYRDARQFQMALEQILVAEGTVATSVQISELMEHLFADRLAEEARSGAPAPASASSTSNVVAPQGNPTAGPDVTLDEPEEPAPDGAVTNPQPALQPRPQTVEYKPESMPRPAAARPQTVEYEPEPVVPRPAAAARPQTVEYNAKRTQTPVSLVESQASRTDDSRPREVIDEREPEPGPPVDSPSSAESQPEIVPRRRSSTGLRKRPSSTSMPEAPPRKSRSSLPSRPAVSSRRNDSLSELSQALDVGRMRRRLAFKTTILLIFLVAIGAGVFGYLFRDRIPQFLHTPGMLTEGVPVLLSVTSSPPTRVTVIPSSTARDQEPRELGPTSLDRVPGAFVGDTVVLENIDLGIHYEQIIDSGKANEVKTIDKAFKETALRVKTKPQLKNATVWLNGLQKGKVGLSMKVYEGTQTFEIHADTLMHPVEFEVRLDPTKPLHEQEVDVSSAVTGKGQ